MKSQEGEEIELYSDLNARWGGWSTPCSDRFTPGKETRCLLYRGLVGSHWRSGWVRKISPPPGSHPQTVQPVVRRYTDRAIPASFQSCSSYQNAHSLHISPAYPNCLNCFDGSVTVVTIKGNRSYFALFAP